MHPHILHLSIAFALLQSFPALAGDEAARHFADKVQPLLLSRCVSCHGPETSEGKLRLDSRQAALRGGERGPSVVPGKPSDSLLLKMVKHAVKDLEMPPKERLSDDEIASLERWIKEGAPWPRAGRTEQPAGSQGIPAESTEDRIGDAWTDPRNPIVRIFGGQRLELWSLKPVVRVDLPRVAQVDWVHNEIDHFVLARLESAGVAPAPRASRHALGRRLWLDLTGLPPSPDDAAAFEADPDSSGPDAVERLVDRLLASPRFGEHMARMWLDVVRYSDSNGFDWDEFRPQAWRFRDYVIRSFNADKPLDQFIREQLAGDELLDGPPSSPAEQDALIATGFLRLGPHDNAAGLFNEQDRSRAELMADITETTGSAFLGLTLSCCRCHDHKHDPLSQADHYRLRAFFEPVKFADDLPLDLAADQEAMNAHNASVDERVQKLQSELDEIVAKVKERLNKPEATQAEIDAALDESEKLRRDELKAQMEAAKKGKRKFTFGLLMTDAGGDVPPTHVLYQGGHKAPREVVLPGFLSALDPNRAQIEPPPNPNTKGRRLALADWIVSSDNPLTARVFVNRVWQALMGQGLVKTPGDFGLAGAKPDEPELLDWLADEFVHRRWSVRNLVRLIVLSATYQQAATYDEAPAAVAHLLRSPRRLSAEQLRDSLLHVSGLLTGKAGGPPIWPDLPKEFLDSNPAFLDDNELKVKGWYTSPEHEQYARSIFLVQKRNTRVPLLETFDQPDNSVPCARRGASTVAPQAIALLNSPLAVQAARSFAQRVQRESPAEADGQIQRAFKFALQRPPDAVELAACRKLLSERSLMELCRVLLNLNEFAYID